MAYDTTSPDPLPLDADELAELEQFLNSANLPEQAMDLSMLDGFLAALAVGPRNLPPARWLPAIWGGEVAWASRAQQERIHALIFRHANDILFHLRDEPDTFEPLLYEETHDGQAVPIIDAWCGGFVEGMALDEENWQPLLEAAEAEAWLEPILLFGSEAGQEELEREPALAAREAEYAAQLGEAVARIMAWWLPTRKAGSTHRREAPKVGRNDACPCGSGRKFKQCCGRDEPTRH